MINKPKIIKKFQKKNKFGRPGTKIFPTKIAIHYTGKADVPGHKTVSYFNNVVANGYKVNNKYVYASAHFVIDLDGTIYQLIPTDEISYATNSANPYTISVEVATTGIDNHYTDATYKSMVHLCAWLCQYKNLSCKTDIITHTDIVGKNYKLCPIYMVKNPRKMKQFKLDCENLKSGKITLERVVNCTSSSFFPQMIKVIRDVNFHSNPDFNKSSILGIAKAGSVFTVVDFIKRNGTNMYKLKSGVYITASKRYVRDFKA